MHISIVMEKLCKLCRGTIGGCREENNGKKCLIEVSTKQQAINGSWVFFCCSAASYGMENKQDGVGCV